MSNGYLVAAEPDLAAAHELGDGFGLDVIDPATAGDHEAVAAALAGAANVGLLLSRAAAESSPFRQLLALLPARLGTPQLILADPDAQMALPGLPAHWPAMTLGEARRRALELIRRRELEQAQAAPPPVEPEAATPEPQVNAAAEPPTPTEQEEPAPAPLAAPIEEGEPAAVDEEEPAPPPDVLLLFTAEDRGRAETLARALRLRGLNVDAEGGPYAPNQDETRTAEARTAIVLWSPAAQLDRDLMIAADIAYSARNLLGASFDGEPPPRFDIDMPFDLVGWAGDVAAPGYRALVRAIDARLDPSPRTTGSLDLEAENEGRLQRKAAAPEEPSSDTGRDESVPSAPPLESEAFAGRSAPEAEEAPAQAAPAPAPAVPAPQAPAPPPFDEQPAPAPPPRTVEALRHRSTTQHAASAPADATAFAPKKLRRGTPELVRIVIHQPKDLKAVIKAAKQIDPRTAPAPQGMGVGDVAFGAKIGVALEVRGAQCDGDLQRRTWTGEPIDYSYSIEADADVKQVVILARVFIDDAQIGVLAFTRPVMKAREKPASAGDSARLKRHKRVFLSYSSKDRETVAMIATAYQMAGVQHFWDRASLKSGEEWSPRLRREIERSDLFHLCWSKAAAQSEWVAKETEYALTRRRRANGKRPDITVQMLDGPPWAPHPPELDAINFDDFVRAAIVGYARGDVA